MPINNTVNGLMSPFLDGSQNNQWSSTPSTGGSTFNYSMPGALTPGRYSSTTVPGSINMKGLMRPQAGQRTKANPFGLQMQSAPPPGFSRNADGTLVPNNATPQNGGTQPSISGGGGSQPITPNGTDTVMPGGNGTPGNQTVPSFSAGAAQQGNTQGQNTNPYFANSPSFGGLVGGLATTASSPTPQFTAAENQYNQANQQLQQLQTDAATQAANIGGSRTNLAEAGGETGILQNLVSGKEAALTGEMSAAQQAAQTATAQQQAQQSGLAAAGGLAQPQQVGPTNVPFNPTTEQYGSPAAGAYGGGNGLQSVGGIQGQMDIGQQVTQLNSYLGGANVVGSNLQKLISDNNINPTGITYANGAIQFGEQQMSNPQYQEFAGQINDFVSSLAPILGVGGSTTDMKTQMSSQIVNALQSGQSINQVIGYFLQQAQQKIQGLSSGGGAGLGSSSSGGSGNTFGSFF